MPTLETILSEMFTPDGVVRKVMGEGFELRPQQRVMSEAALKAFGARTHLLAEAGTGTGKSLAYLLPALVRATVFGEVALISTHTISLQEQLVEKDIPLVRTMVEELARSGSLPPAQTMNGEYATLKPVLVKGRGNYVSIRRLKLASERQDKLFADTAQRRTLHVIEDWAMRTLDGTTSTLPPLERGGVWDKVQSDSGNCMGKKCPQFAQCFYQRARAELEGANVLVCNHALFFSDLALRAQDAGFLPAYQHVVLDEGHNVEEVAGEHFGVSLAEGRVNWLLHTLYQPRTGKGYLPQLGLLTDEVEEVRRAMGLVERAAHASGDFFQGVLARAERAPEIATGGGKSGAWFDRGGRRTADGDRAGEPIVLRLRQGGQFENLLTPACRELGLRLKALREHVKQDADRYELNSYAQRAEMIAADAEVLVSHALPGFAYWAEVTGGDDEMTAGRGRRVSLSCAPVEVGELLKERLFRAEHSVVLTSATLATKTVAPDASREHREVAFAHLMQRLGCDGAETLQVGSPFNYATQVACIVDARSAGPRSVRGPRGGSPGAGRTANDGPSLVFEAQEAEERARRELDAGRRKPDDPERLSELILDHVVQTEGGAFVLFTSFFALRRCTSLLAEALLDARMPLLAQGRDGSRTLMLQRFRENPRSVLFGAASFWQGVDVRGDALRNVIITKLPFDPPDRPLTEARLELIEQRGGNPFMEESLPRAVIKFKQGFGRLIRSATDRGRVVVLDPRVVTARYGRLFLESLPSGVQPKVLRDGMHDEA